MAQHAWLDSLSEDWVSQPRSEDSLLQLPPSTSNSKPMPNQASRIPRFSNSNISNKIRSQPIQSSSSPRALSERSQNDINIKGAQLGPSKLSQELKASHRGRSVSDSESGSVIHNSVVQNKSQSASPSKGRETMPEWRKRLVLGELNYGETKDLFSSAGTGLENMFRPPPLQLDDSAPEIPENEGHQPNETTLPSSPPAFTGFRQPTVDDDGSEEQVQERNFAQYDESVQPDTTLPKPVKFRPTHDDSSQESSGMSVIVNKKEDRARQPQSNGSAQSSAMFHQTKPQLRGSRVASGQSDTRNEDFSPIFIGRHSSDGGKVSYAPMDIPPHQLRKKLENLCRNQMVLDPDAQDEGDGRLATGEGTIDIDNTEDYVRNGGFVNIKRGGRSEEGSFRHRPLSPPADSDSELLPESSLQASTPKQFPTVRTERFVSGGKQGSPGSPQSWSLPPAPYPSPEKRLPFAPGQSTSPLKLFGPYDTFTNKTLVRRLSQLEHPRNGRSSPSPQDDTFLSRSGPSALGSSSLGSFLQKTSSANQAHHEAVGIVNNFGAGGLDKYEFDGDSSLSSCVASNLEGKENVTPPQSRIPSNHSLKFNIHEDSSIDGDSLRIRPHRHKASRSAPTRHIRISRSLDGLHSQRFPSVSGLHAFAGASLKRDGSEGKRPRTSPSKDPTPKRRRTLHPSDFAYGLEDRHAIISTVQSSHQSMQTAITKSFAFADESQSNQPFLVAGMPVRQILRPRAPTPNQRKSSDGQRQPLGELDIKDQAAAPDQEARDVEVNGSRKSSMKTQDFFDAANAIMAQIRNRGRPKSALSSVQESNIENSPRPTENGFNTTEDSFQESTREPFSRPPSRDGPPLSRVPLRQEDPQLADRLRKYEEHSEIGDVLTQSTHSSKRPDVNAKQFSGLSQTDLNKHLVSEPGPFGLDDNVIATDIPNIRISRNPDHGEQARKPSDFPTNSSRSSAASTGRSIPTGSSRGSDSRRLIAPDAVSQLIGHQVGNMVYNEKTKVWQKIKKVKVANTVNILPSEDSEEDPFASIPDLTVDVDTERRNLGLSVNSNRPSLEQFLNHDDSHVDTSTETATSRFTSTTNDQLHAETAVEDDKEIEHEITLHEDRMQNTPPSRRKNLTISFSSPIASIIHDITRGESRVSSHENEHTMEQPLGGFAEQPRTRDRQAQLRSVSVVATKSTSRSRSRGISKARSAEGKGFVPRPVSRIDEQDENASVGDGASEAHGQISIRPEDSLIQPHHKTRNPADLSVVMATPGRRQTRSMSATPMIGQHVGNLSLSPLSEFTVHQVDRSCALEVSYAVDDRYLVTGDGSKKIMSKAVRNLVEKISEVEPFEPDWGSIQELDISGKRLDTLHMLDRFCPQVVVLDVSKNSVTTLDGVPQSVRNLCMNQNLLSELAAWRHLMNLQYVDISNNQITSLSAFKDLVHLRTLCADNNQITSLDGVKFHDGLEILRARDNLITHVDFDGTRMQQLTELDLEGNQIISFENGDQLTNLATLNLQRNSLKSFVSQSQPFKALRSLKISSNGISAFDLGITPCLKMLYADRNSLGTVTGFSHCRRLDSLSLREQKGEASLDLSSFIDSACEVRKLYLSGNRLSEFNPRRDFLNLQYLEVANCGLQSLPSDLGEKMPNLRTININFNAIGDLMPLRYIIRLKKLLAAGNRFVDSGAVANAIAYLPHLARLDLRDNGMTIGFYPPIQALVPVEEKGNTIGPEAFTLPDADIERYEKYASRLDMNTRVRKRVYDMALIRRCGRLKMLDGLPVAVNPWDMRDETWQALVRTNVIAAELGGDAPEPESEAESVRDAGQPEPDVDYELELEEPQAKPRVRFQAEPALDAQPESEHQDNTIPEPDLEEVDDELVNESALYEHLEEMSSIWEAENSFGP